MSELLPEDYKEPRCLSCTDFYEPGEDANVIPVPVDRIIDKLDKLLSHNDMNGARRHLEYWRAEAEAGHDRRGLVAVLNELMGLYRKMGLGDKAFEAAQRAQELISELQMQDSVTAGTVWLNSATVCEAFDRSKEAVELYSKALDIYEKYLDNYDVRLGGLYNNMALACVSQEMYKKAEELYQKAIEVMSRQPSGLPELAITYLNLANALEAEHGLESAIDGIDECVEKAEQCLFDESNEQNGNYAFVCEKCAPTFQYYGRFMTAQELKRRSKDIYERA